MTFLAPTYPQSSLHASLAICLCGEPVIPRLSGIHPFTDQFVIGQLFAVLASIKPLRQEIARTADLADGSASATATLTGQIARLERSCQLLRQRLQPALPAVTLSRPPRRAAATKAGLDAIVLELQRTGVTLRQARQVVWAVRDLWKAALLKGESIETPFGILTPRKTPSGRWRFVLGDSPDLDSEVR